MTPSELERTAVEEERRVLTRRKRLWQLSGGGAALTAAATVVVGLNGSWLLAQTLLPVMIWPPLVLALTGRNVRNTVARLRAARLDPPERAWVTPAGDLCFFTEEGGYLGTERKFVPFDSDGRRIVGCALMDEERLLRVHTYELVRTRNGEREVRKAVDLPLPPGFSTEVALKWARWIDTRATQRRPV